MLVAFNNHFFYLRHGETDHNRHRISDDDHDISLNDSGVMQANRIGQFMKSVQFPVVCVSPLKRAQETLDIICKHRKQQPDVEILEEFRECTHKVWEEMTSAEKEEYSKPSQLFLGRVQEGLNKVLKKDTPLVIAHGGVFWAICHHLQLEKNRYISNCQLVEFLEVGENDWKLTYHNEL